jgi:zinc protease
MLSSGGSSYLSQKYVRNAHPLMSEISLASFNLRHSGIIYFNGELMEGVDIEKFKKQFTSDLSLFCSEGLNARTLQKTKNQIMSQAYTQMKTNAGMASTIMMNEKLYGDYAFGTKELEIYNSVKESEVKEACNEVLLKAPSLFISIWDKYPKNLNASKEIK